MFFTFQISPQFRGIPNSGVKTRRGRKNRALGISTRSRNVSGRSNASMFATNRKHLPKGFVPLKLVGDKSLDSANDSSVTEDISFSDDTFHDQVSDGAVINDDKEGFTNESNMINKTLDLLTRDKPTTRNRKRLSTQGLSSDIGREILTPGALSSHVSRNTRSRRSCSIVAENGFETPCRNKEQPSSSTVRNPYNKEIDVSFSEESLNSPAEKKDNGNVVKNTKNHKLGKRIEKRSKPGRSKVSDSSPVFGTQCRHHVSDGVLSPKLLFNKSVSLSQSEESSLRKKTLGANNYDKSKRQALFDTPPRSNKKTSAAILAYDTPESEYGLPVRKRQLQYFLRKRQSKKSTK